MKNALSVGQGNVLAAELLRSGEGANAHAINKAAFYLRFERMSVEKRYDLAIEVRIAMTSKKYEALAHYMRRWW